MSQGGEVEVKLVGINMGKSLQTRWKTIVKMNLGLRPVLDAIDMDGCPVCGEHPVGIQVNGPDAIILEGGGHVIDAKAWADEQCQKHPDEE